MGPIETHLALIDKLLSAPIDAVSESGRRLFARGGPLQPRLIVALLLALVRYGGTRGYRRMLEAFWDEAGAQGAELPQPVPVSAQAFSSARSKLPSEVVRSLVHSASDEFDRVHGAKVRWRGRRLLAIDGARRFVQPSSELRLEYDGPGGCHYPQIHVTALYDVVAKVPVDAVVGPYGSDERAQLMLVIDRMRKGDVAVLDRGYPSHDTIATFLLHGVDFIMRCPAKSTFAAVTAFLATGRTEGVIEITPAAGSTVGNCEPMSVRIVVSTEGHAEPWVLLTSLDADEFPAEAIVEAYAMRWSIEELNKLVAGTYFGQGFFHSLSPDGVRQEIYTQFLFVALARHVAAVAAQVADVPYERISQKAIILAMGDYLTRLTLRQTPERVRSTMLRLLRRLAAAVEKPRRRRSYPRRSWLPGPKWGPSGRNSGR